MPTYVCSIPAGHLSDNQKVALANAITRIHSEETGAPRYFVQVEMQEIAAGERFLGGTHADGQIWIRGDIRAGRTEKQRETMLTRIMNEANEITQTKKDDIWVYICNLAPTDMIEYGNVLPRPGEEEAWYDKLPSSLKNYLATLGTTRENFTL
jgi:phenylpyruvate tautomerase PptA (4-oxalocrotonate tautomerase family)